MPILGGGQVVVGPASGATEATLISVLNAVVAADQDIEILLVRDTGNSDEVVQQITNYETGTPVVSYKDASGAAYVVVGPLEYLDPAATMNLLLTEALAQGTTLDSILLDTTSIAAEDFATQATLALAKTVLDTIKVDTAAAAGDLAAIETLLTTIDAVLDTIKTDTGVIRGHTDGINNTLNAVEGRDSIAGGADGLRVLGNDGAVDRFLTTDAAGHLQVDILSGGGNPATEGVDGTAHGAAQEGIRALGTDGTNDQQLLTDATGALQVDILSGGGSITEGTDGAAHGASQLGIRALGTDGTNDQQISTDADGHIQVDILSGGGTPGAALEVTLLALSAKLNSLGQKASAASAPVVLSTEQEAILAGIDTVLDNIKLDTAALVVDAAAIEVLITQIDVVLDTIKVDTGLMVTDLAAIEVLLTTIDTVLDTIKTDTAAMVVDLAAIEVNTNIQSLTLTSSSTTGAGTITSGAYAATIFIDGIGGEVNGVVRPNGWSQTFEFYNYTLPVTAIPYNGNGATVYVDIFS